MSDLFPSEIIAGIDEVGRGPLAGVGFIIFYNWGPLL